MRARPEIVIIDLSQHLAVYSIYEERKGTPYHLNTAELSTPNNIRSMFVGVAFFRIESANDFDIKLVIVDLEWRLVRFIE